MDNMLFERFLILLVALAIALLAGYMWRSWLATRRQRLAAQPIPEALARSLPGGPALLYFTTQSCAQCHLQQAPILRQLAQTAQIPIHTYDAAEEEQLVRFFGVMTVPTTIWLDAQRRPAAINHGLAHLSKLRQQARQLGALTNEPLHSSLV
jgi:thiol-disulfide isomerase/thioredoxin